jgi:S-adenosyl methyltransferase
VTGAGRQDEERRDQALLIDATVANAGRVANYLDGGRDNFEADRKAARSLVAAAPAIGLIAPAWHAFFRRAVRYLVREAGVRQFLHIAIALAASNYADEFIWSVDPGCRIALVGSDPLVLAHARALMRAERHGSAGHPGGTIGYVRAEVTDPGAIVAGAREMLDFSQPVAIALPFTLGFVADTAAAAGIVSALAGAVPSGSHVVIHHIASELNPALAEAARRWNRVSPQPVTLRSKDEVARLVAGLDLVPPGVVPICEWRPAPGDPDSEEVVPLHAVVARKS